MGVSVKSRCRCRWTKAAAGAPMLTIKSSGCLAKRARRYSTNGASGSSSLERALTSEWSVMSNRQGDCRSSSRTNGFGVFAPGLEISSERMKQHDPFGLGCGDAEHCKEKNGRSHTDANGPDYSRPVSGGMRRIAPFQLIEVHSFPCQPESGPQHIVSAMTSQRVLRRFAKDWVTRVVRCPLRDPMVACWNGVMVEATARPQQASDPLVRG